MLRLPGNVPRSTFRGEATMVRVECASGEGGGISKEEVEKLDDMGTDAWNGGDVDAFVRPFSDDFVWKDRTLPEPIRTKDQAKEYFSSWITAFPGMKVTLLNRVVSDDAVGRGSRVHRTNTGR